MSTVSEVQKRFRLYVFNHHDKEVPYKKIRTFEDEIEALGVACNILRTIAKDFREDLYAFMEQKNLIFDEINWEGVHIYNGNVPWSIFVTGALLEEKLIGPLGYKNPNTLNLSSPPESN